MPLQPAFTWKQTEESIQITVDNIPIKDQHQLFCADLVVKLNCPPYLLLLDLAHPVDDARSTATIFKGQKLVFKLHKVEPGVWENLTANGDPLVIKKLREESIRRYQEKSVAAHKQRLARQQREDKAAVDLQIQQQKAQRDQLEALKHHELQEQRLSLQQWQQKLDQEDDSDYENELENADAEIASQLAGSSDSSGTTAAGQLSCTQEHEAYYGKGWWPSRAQSQCIEQGDSANMEGSDVLAVQQAHSTAHIGPCSNAGADAALRTQELPACDGYPACDKVCSEPTSIGHTCGHAVDGRRSHQQRPAAQKESAHSINSSKAGASKKLPAPVRAHAAPVQINFTQLQTPHLPARQQRELEIRQLKRTAGHQSDSLNVTDRQPAFLKDKGDAFAAQGNYRSAINAYSKALQLDSKQAAVYANRAAAYLALGQADECVQDCTAAIGLLDHALAALQGPCGAAAEKELQAGMLGAAQSAAASCATRQPQAQHAAESSSTSALPATLHNGDDTPLGASRQKESQAEMLSSQQHIQNLHDISTGTCHLATANGCSATGQQSGDQQKASQQHVPEHQKGTCLAEQLKHLLVSLLARRAAAHVDLQHLSEAANDLQHALKLDPANPSLAADALEVSLALCPSSGTDPAMIKQLAAARFKSGDMSAAAEAFTLLLQVLQCPGAQAQHQDQATEQNSILDMAQDAKWQQEQQQLQLAAALSNRAACWLGLSQHKKCVTDSLAAMRMLWAAQSTELWQEHCLDAASVAEQCNTPAVGTSTMSTISDGISSSSRVGACTASEHFTNQVAGALQNLQQHSPALLLQHSEAAARSAARTATRMAAALRCLKLVEAADAAFQWAAACWLLVGDQGKAAAIHGDQQLLQQWLH